MNLNKIVQQSVEEFIEKGADLEHSRWAKWQKYLHSLCSAHTINSLNSVTKQYEDIQTGGLVIHKDRVQHWERQIATPYSELTEKEKEYDRVETKNYIPLLISSHISLIEAEIARKKSVSKEIETGSKMIFSSQEKRQAVWEFIQEDIQYLEGELEACKKLTNA